MATTAGKKPALVYLDPDDKARFKAAAQAEGLSLSKFAYLAMAERESRKPIFRISELRALARVMFQVRRAGININEMLRNLHVFREDPTARVPDVQLIEWAVKEYGEAMTDLRAFIESHSHGH